MVRLLIFPSPPNLVRPLTPLSLSLGVILLLGVVEARGSIALFMTGAFPTPCLLFLPLLLTPTMFNSALLVPYAAPP